LLRTHRLQLGLTQEGVAERAGLSVHAIQKLERGATHPYRDTINRLVAALRLSGGDEAEFRELGRPAARHQRDGASGSSDDVQLGRPDLPVPLTSFVGREREIAEINTLLELARLINPAGQHTAHLGAVGVAADPNRPLVVADRAQVLLGLLELLGIALQVEHDVAQKRAQSTPVSIGGWPPVAAA